MEYPNELDLKDVIRIDIDRHFTKISLIDIEGRSYIINENLLAKVLRHDLRKLRATIKRTRYHLSEY